MNTGSLLSILGGVLTVTGVLAAAFAVVRSSYTNTRLDILRASVVDYEGRTEQLEADRARLKLVNVELVAKVEILESIVTSRDAIEQLLLKSHTHSVEAVIRYDKIIEKLDKIERARFNGNS